MNSSRRHVVAVNYLIKSNSLFFFLVSNRTVYIHGFNKMDFALWHSAITLAAGTDGRALSDQQLTKNGVPIVVDSCIAFVTQYGELRYIYLPGGGRGREGGEPVLKNLLIMISPLRS